MVCAMTYLLTCMSIILDEICVLFVAEEGRAFIFHGGNHFPRGNATYGCHGDIEPCPEEKVKRFPFLCVISLHGDGYELI